MNLFTYLRLCVMMFIQFFVWGAWYVTAPVYLQTIGFGGPDFGWTYSVGPIAGLISPFIVGMIADRFFSTERVLAVMHFLGAAAMFGAIFMMRLAEPSPVWINIMFFGHMLCFYPTLALTNSLALHNMTNPEKQFPLIRVFGTIGWIIAGWVITWQKWDGSINMFYLTACAALLMGLYCLTLPHTPPPAAGKKVKIRELLGLDALVLLTRRSYLVFMVSSMLICIPLAFYYQMASRVVQQAGMVPGFTMTFGQISEIVFMLIMPLFFVRLGVKWMLFVGMLAWVARYALFAVGAPDQVVWMILLGVVLHGICYDFFFVTGQIYTDRVAPKQIRSQAQGMLVLFTLGIGMLIGAQVGGQVEGMYTPKEKARLENQANAVGNKIGEMQQELASLIEDSKIPADAQFDQMIETERKVNPVQPPSLADSLMSWVFVDQEAPIKGFTEQAEKERKKLQSQIDNILANAKKHGDQLAAPLEELKTRLDDAKTPKNDKRAASMQQGIGGRLAASADELRMKELDKVKQEIKQREDEEIEWAAATAARLMRDKIEKYEKKTGETIPAGLSKVLVLHGQIECLTKYKELSDIRAVQAIQWRWIWTLPCLGAAFIMVAFALLFKDDSKSNDDSSSDTEEAA